MLKVERIHKQLFSKKKYKVQRRIHKQLFSAILGEKSTVARGCTSLEDESKYICDTHKAGSYVSISKDKVKKCEFFLFKICEKQKIFFKPRCTHRATAMETVAMRIGTPQDNLRPWRWFSIHGCRRAGSWMGMWSKATLRILSLKQERERACWKGQSLSCSIDFCCFDLSMTTSQWEIYYPQSNLFYGKGKNPSTEWKRLTAKQGYLFHEFPNLRKLFVGWTTHFNLVLKMGRLQMK